MTCWQTLGIASTSDEAAIKKAYAARIRGLVLPGRVRGVLIKTFD